MAMEKYGVNMEELPPTDDQMMLIQSLAKKAGTIESAPSNRKEAEQMIDDLMSRGGK